MNIVFFAAYNYPEIMKHFLLLLFNLRLILHYGSSFAAPDATVLTVASESNHGLERLLRSAQINNIKLEVLGLGKQWNGGDMNTEGGGQKVNYIKEKIDNLFKDGKTKDDIVLVTDGYDVIYLSPLDEIVRRFKAMEDTRILFSAEVFCWPDASLASSYPTKETEVPYLNSGGFIGYLGELRELVNYRPVKDKDDDQMYYTQVYLDQKMRETLKISLDHKSTIFQNLNGALLDVKLRNSDEEEWPFIENTASGEKPLIVHGNGPSKTTLNQFGNYVAKAWSPIHGCKMCEEKAISLDEKSLPKMMIAVFIEQATPFIEEFLQSILDLDYAKDKISLLIHNNVDYHLPIVEEFVSANSASYAAIKLIKPVDAMIEADARKFALDRCASNECEYLLVVDSVARLNSNTLKSLMSSGYDVVAPFLARTGQAWSNFWGALSAEGYYSRSTDYMDIVNRKMKGIWNVPFITHCYLLKTSILRTPAAKAITYHKRDVDPDMTFCASLRKLGIFMHVNNLEDFGHLVDAENFDISRTHPNIYQVMNNRLEWEARYLHKEYYANFDEERKPAMPCPDVYWFPVMSMRFTTEWIAVMEAFGRWSDGSNSDNRLESGYEAVPTRDIHMNQVGLQTEWLYILKEYVRPLQELVFTGYYHNPPVSLMNFVVRYRPDEQPSLRPHHDSSTYTINLALNTPHLDYEGGGCRFIRYNCSVRDTRPGWLLMHPGRLTHYHEGLRVTNGTRYIMISFVDP